MSRRMSVEHRRYAAEIADTPGWQFWNLFATHQLIMRIKYARKLLFFIIWLLYVQLLGAEQIWDCESRYDQSAWTAN